MPDRLAQLTQWVAKETQSKIIPLTVVSGDASFRRYFRRPEQSGQPSLIAVDAPPDKEPLEPFLRVTRLLSSTGVCVPRILAHNTKKGFMLLSDFGDRVYLPELNANNADVLYQDAIAALIAIQRNGQQGEQVLPPYNKQQLHREMELFREWFVGKHLKMSLSADEQNMFDQWFELLSTAALGQSQVTVHRDYHSRNLMILAENSPGIIDYQDALWGPITYDLVSLFKDCYVAWPRKQQIEWLETYAQAAIKAGMSLPSMPQLIRDYDWMGLQRHIKVAGIFCRLLHRDGKAGYLKDIPLTLGYIVQAMDQYDEFAEPRQWFMDRLKPHLIEANLMWKAVP